MTIQIMISVKSGAHTRGEILDLEDLDAEALARVDDLMHEMRDYIERCARVLAAKRARQDGGL